jgi:hypothetical protein
MIEAQKLPTYDKMLWPALQALKNTDVRRHEVPTRARIRDRRVVHHAACNDFNSGDSKCFSRPLVFHLGSLQYARGV